MDKDTQIAFALVALYLIFAALWLGVEWGIAAHKAKLRSDQRQKEWTEMLSAARKGREIQHEPENE